MRFSLLAVGPRGDVQPMVALAVGLRAAGHDVSVVTHSSYAGIAKNFNLPVVCVRPDMEELLEGAGAAFLRNARRSNARLAFGFQRLIAPYYGTWGQQCLDASAGADVVISNPVSAIMAFTIAEKLGARPVTSFWTPTYPSRPCAGVNLPRVPAWLGTAAGTFNWYAFAAVAVAQWLTLRTSINRWRTSIGLRPLGPRGPLDQFLANTSLQAFSEVLVRRPPDWPDHVHVTGFWGLPSPPEWTPPENLVRFLQDGAPPVAVTLGSMYRGAGKAQMIVAALRRLRLRGVLTGVGADPGPLTGSDMYYARSIPHDWLFERASAVVNHGSGGVSRFALLAGRPIVPLPLMNAEPFWADTLHARGVATEPLGARAVTVERLASAIQTATTDAGMRQCAEVIGSQLARENGVGCAVHILESTVTASD